MEYIVSREGIGYSIKSKLDDKHSDTLKTIIRQHWKETLDGIDKSKSKTIAMELETHISSMNSVVDPMDYEAFCIPNIIQHSKHMSKEEFSTYLRLIESMAIGYSDHLGKELTNLVLIGVTSKGRSATSAERYLALLLKDINNRANYYQLHINKRSRHVYALSSRLRAHQSSILRVFKRRRIRHLSKTISSKNREIEIMKDRLARCNVIISRINSTRTRKATAPTTPPRQPSMPSGSPRQPSLG